MKFLTRGHTDILIQRQALTPLCKSLIYKKLLRTDTTNRTPAIDKISHYLEKVFHVKKDFLV